MGIWIEHEYFPITAWQEAVAHNHTRLGYWDWVDGEIEKKRQEQQAAVEAVDYE